MSAVGSKRYLTVGCYDMQLDNGGEGTPHVILSLRVLEGPETGHNLTARLYLSEKATPYTLKALRALGWTGTKISKALSEGLGSRKATAQMLTDEYKGKISEKVNGIFEWKPFSLTKNPVDKTSLEAFDAMFEDAASVVEVCEPSEAANVGVLPAAVARVKAPAVANPNELGF